MSFFHQFLYMSLCNKFLLQGSAAYAISKSFLVLQRIAIQRMLRCSNNYCQSSVGNYSIKMRYCGIIAC